MNEQMKKIWQELTSYQTEIFSYIKNSIGDGLDAEDLFQEVYLIALENIHRLRADGSLKNWLITVTRNKVINHLRDRGKRKFVECTQIEEQAVAEDQIVDEALAFALRMIPKNQRSVLIAREWDGLDYKQLAKKFTLSESAVTSLLHRARQNFRTYYSLYFLPRWVREKRDAIPVQDLVRLVELYGHVPDHLHEIQVRSQRLFSKLDSKWQHYHHDFLPRARWMQIMEDFGDISDRVVLDAGAGPGLLSAHLARKAKKVIALDLNNNMLKQLRQLKHALYLDNLAAVRGDLRRISFREATIDIIVAAFVLHHLPRPNFWIQRARQLLSRDGRLLIIEFGRHGNREFADAMHDLWMGFRPQLVQKWAMETGFRLLKKSEWQSLSGLPVFCQLFKKNHKIQEGVV